MRAGTNYIESDTRNFLDCIEKIRDSCQFNTQKPRKCKFHLRDDNVFSYTACMSIFNIEIKAQLRIVDEETCLKSARGLADLSSTIFWGELCICWIDFDLGPRVRNYYDTGRILIGSSFRTSTDILHILSPTNQQAAWHFLKVTMRRHVAHIVSPEIGHHVLVRKKRYNAFQSSQRLHRSCWTSLYAFCFSCLRRNPTVWSSRPAPLVFEQAVALQNATNAMSNHFASRPVWDALETRNGQDVLWSHKDPIGLPALVYRPEKDFWKVPYSIL